MATLTVYPDSTHADGAVWQYVAAGDTWSNLVSAAGTNVSNKPSTATGMGCISDTDTNEWGSIYRSIFQFDTSSLPDDAVINSAILYIFFQGKLDSLGITPQSAIFSSNPASEANIVAGDYDSLGATQLSGSVNWADIVTINDYTPYILNASGIAAINKTGTTKLGLRILPDVNDSAPSWSSLAGTYTTNYFSGNTGTSKDPKLVITYNETPAAFTPKVLFF